jgi:hypothetical protein
MTDNVHLAASTLAAEQVIFGITCGHPFLLHHLGSAIALAPDPLSGEDLRWHQQLYDIQQSLLPAIYTDMTMPEDTPAPRNYLRQLSEAGGIPYTASMESVAHMVYMPTSFLSKTLDAVRERRSSSSSSSSSSSGDSSSDSLS